MIQKLRLISAIGQFDSVSSAATIDLRKLTIVYAENARGKTTLAAIMRSLSTGEAVPINERRRLGAVHAPEVVIECTGSTSPACFQNGVWSRTCPDVLVFDDFFVDRNVYSGMEVEAEHRQNLHDLILGATGVALARRVDDLATQIRTHNAELRNRGDAIPAADRYGLTVDDFCGLTQRPDIENAIKEAEQRLSALQNANTVRSTPEFATLGLPAVDLGGVQTLLGRTVADLDKQAADAVKAHFAALGEGAEEWVGTGMRYGTNGARLSAEDDCPFCKQALAASDMFIHYRAYFGQAYTEFQAELAAAQVRIERVLDGDALAGFERQVRTAEDRCRLWARFTTVPEVSIDTSAVATAWQQARDVVLVTISAKRADPLTATALSADAAAAQQALDTHRAISQDADDLLRMVLRRILVSDELCELFEGTPESKEEHFIDLVLRK